MSGTRRSEAPEDGDDGPQPRANSRSHSEWSVLACFDDEA
jgi:hypothetical protein